MTVPVTTPQMVYSAVERGIAWLDEHAPGWEKEISLETLDLQDANFCVLGQLATTLLPDDYVSLYPYADLDPQEYDFHDVVDHYDLNQSESGPEDYGFDARLGRPESETKYEMLTIAWKEKIAERLAQQ